VRVRARVRACVKANVCYCHFQGFDLMAFFELYWLCFAILQQYMYSKVVCVLQYYITKNAIILAHCPSRTALVLATCSRVIDNHQKVSVL
jgi:hypothetical protein